MRHRHLSTQVGSITFWCSDTAVVDKAHDFFHRALGFESECAPHHETQSQSLSSATSPLRPRWSPNRYPYRSIVTTKDIRVQFIAYPWVSKIRELLSLPRCSRLLSLELSTSEIVCDRQPPAARPTEAALRTLLPLCLLSKPVVSPTLRVCQREQRDSIDLGSSPEPSEDDAHSAGRGRVSGIKEIVLGLEDQKVSRMAATLQALAKRKLSHGLLSFGDDNGEATAVRVIPSKCSTVVFRVDACQTAIESIGRASRCSFAAIGRNGMSRGDFSLESPGLAGLDLRISDSDTLQAHFYETPESSRSDQANFGERDDMGQMSCVSVVGMEAKHRMRSLPSSLVQQVSKRAV